jgi:hypothetical protein
MVVPDFGQLLLDSASTFCRPTFSLTALRKPLNELRGGDVTIGVRKRDGG